MVKRLVWGVAALALLSGGGSQGAIAQEQQYVEVGEGLKGMPMYLDLSSVRGTNFRVVQQYGDGIGIIEVAAYCREKRLFTERVGIYNPKGEVISEDLERKEGAFVPGSPVSEAMAIVCKYPPKNLSK